MGEGRATEWAPVGEGRAREVARAGGEGRGRPH